MMGFSAGLEPINTVNFGLSTEEGMVQPWQVPDHYAVERSAIKNIGDK